MSTDISTRFGQRIRELRTRRGMTQLEVAIRFGIDRSYLSDVERGRKTMTLPFVETVAHGFKMSLSELLQDL